VVDLGAVLGPAALDEAIDRALARGLVTVAHLMGRLDGPSMRYQPGRRRILASLERRGYLGGPTPSVLESKVLRLLLGAGIRPLRCEEQVRWEGGHYRLDFTLADKLVLEVDGYAYHAGSEAFRRDLRRRNRLIGQGWTILVYSWLDVTTEGGRVVREVRRALAAHAHR
jgi:very-short-patch-repair endonuclease